MYNELNSFKININNNLNNNNINNKYNDNDDKKNNNIFKKVHHSNYLDFISPNSITQKSSNILSENTKKEITQDIDLIDNIIKENQYSRQNKENKETFDNYNLKDNNLTYLSDINDPYIDYEPNIIKKSLAEYKIIEFEKFIENCQIKVIKEMSNPHANYLCWGNKKIIIYDDQFNELNQKNFENYVENIYERNTNHLIVICSENKNNSLIEFKIKNNNYVCVSNIRNLNISACNFFQLGKGDFKHAICNENGAYVLENIFYNEAKKKIKITDKYYKGGIGIDNNKLVITSNSILKNGEDKLICFFLPLKKIIFEIEGYSFILSTNGISSISIEDDNILLCACKQYTNSQKNGILIVFIKYLKCNYFFIETGNYEVYCFCPIINEYSNIKFFLVGGYDNKKYSGIIKLYAIICNKENIFNSKIEYIQNFDFKEINLKIIKYPITCITQLKNKKILVCFDNIALFSEPNLQFFSKNYNNLKIKHFFKDDTN